MRTLLIAVLLVQFGCAPGTERSINYINQPDPGLTATLFAPDVISTNEMEHSSPAFAPDGSRVLWCVVNSSYRSRMMEMEFVDGTWSAPHRPSFADSTADDYYPTFSADGSTLYFGSRRALPPRTDMSIWQVALTKDGWGTPIPIDSTVSKGHEYGFSVSKDGSIFFVSSDSWDIQQAVKSETGYQRPVTLPYSVNGLGYEDGPFIAPDGSYMIYESQRPDGVMNSIDLYITFFGGGRWSAPINMGNKINTEFTERLAKVSPDGKYLFFGSTRLESDTRRGFDIYWISASIIDELRNNSRIEPLDRTLGTQLLTALHSGDNDITQPLLYRWVNSYGPSADANILYLASLRKSKDYAKASAYLSTIEQESVAESPYLVERALIKYALNEDEAGQELLTQLKGNPWAMRDSYLYISSGLLDAGKYTESDEYFQKAMDVHALGHHWLERAKVLAKAKRMDGAFSALSKAVALGGITKADLTTPELAALQADKRWSKLVEGL